MKAAKAYTRFCIVRTYPFCYLPNSLFPQLAGVGLCYEQSILAYTKGAFNLIKIGRTQGFFLQKGGFAR